MLAVVDDLSDAGMQIGGCTPAEVAASLNELHAKACLRQSTGSAHAGHAATNDRDESRGRLRIVQCLGQSNLFMQAAELQWMQPQPTNRAAAIRARPAERIATF